MPHCKSLGQCNQSKQLAECLLEFVLNDRLSRLNADVDGLGRKLKAMKKA